MTQIKNTTKHTPLDWGQSTTQKDGYGNEITLKKKLDLDFIKKLINRNKRFRNGENGMRGWLSGCR